VDLIAVPEGTVPTLVDDPEAEELMGFLRATAERLEAPLVFGGLGRVQESGIRVPKGLVSNSAFLLSPDGRGLQRYDKTRLVPVMESGAYGRESSLVLLESDGLFLAPLVCYESIFGGLARRGVREGAELLLNLSSDIWFGHEDSFLGSLFLLQHPAHLVMRAVENRTPAARAANGGHSYVIDPLGRIVSDPVPPGGGAVVSRVLRAEEGTLFSRTGDWTGPVSLAAAILFLVFSRRVGRGFGTGR
jgi:apolipoprotein N-acyltransferase